VPRRAVFRRTFLAASILLSGCATTSSHRLAERMPAELPDAMTIAGWERFAGQAQIGDASVVYELYVNPVRPALYEITRYRLTTTATGTDGRSRSQEETEKVLWNAAPGTRAPLQAFEWIANRTWRKLWLGAGGEWRRIDPSTPAYKSEMRTAIRVYAVHNERGTR
jgi:hypothetical protein